MPRKLKCCVGNCQNLRQDAFLYKIPFSEKRLKVWLKCLKHVCDVENLVPGRSVVCSNHFEARFRTSKSRLKAEAYPSLFTNLEISTGTPSLEYTETNNPAQEEQNFSQMVHYDHNYCKQAEEDQRHGCGPVTKKKKILSGGMEPLEDSNIIAGPSRLSMSMPDSELHSKLHTGAGCEWSRIDQRGEHMERPMSSSGLSQADDDDDDFLSIGCVPLNVLHGSKAIASTSTASHPEIPDIDMDSLNESNEPIETQEKSTPDHSKFHSEQETGYSFSKRLMSKTSELSPLCLKIYREYKKAKKQLSFHKRTKDALKFSRQTTLEKLTRNMNSHARTFLAMQVNLCNKKKNARRYTTEEKDLCLSIMKQSPKCYRFLSKIFILPSSLDLSLNQG